VAPFVRPWIPVAAHEPVLVLLPLAVVFAAAWFLAWTIRRNYQRAVRTVLNERGYPVCMSCGYSLAGLETGRCPECGQTS
jgi:rubrerythrin